MSEGEYVDMTLASGLTWKVKLYRNFNISAKAVESASTRGVRALILTYDCNIYAIIKGDSEVHLVHVFQNSFVIDQLFNDLVLLSSQ